MSAMQKKNDQLIEGVDYEDVTPTWVDITHEYIRIIRNCGITDEIAKALLQMARTADYAVETIKKTNKTVEKMNGVVEEVEAQEQKRS